MDEEHSLPRMVGMVIEENAVDRHTVQFGVLQGSPLSPIVFAIYTSGLMKWAEEDVSAKELPWSTISARWRLEAMVFRSSQYLRHSQRRASSAQADERYSSTT